MNSAPMSLNISRGMKYVLLGCLFFVCSMLPSISSAQVIATVVLGGETYTIAQGGGVTDASGNYIGVMDEGGTFTDVNGGTMSIEDQIGAQINVVTDSGATVSTLVDGHSAEYLIEMTLAAAAGADAFASGDAEALQAAMDRANAALFKESSGSQSDITVVDISGGFAIGCTNVQNTTINFTQPPRDSVAPTSSGSAPVVTEPEPAVPIVEVPVEVVPAAPSPSPAALCTSPANSCGQTNSGTVNNGVCSASAPSDDECPIGCGSGVEDGTCSVDAQGHGGYSGSCIATAVGSCSYQCLGGVWVPRSNSCDVFSDPVISIGKKDVRKGTPISFTYDTGGYTCLLRAGNTVLFSGLNGAGATPPTPIQAQTTYVLECDGANPVSTTVRILPVGFES